MGRCKYCGKELIKEYGTCKRCNNLKHRHPELFGYVLVIDLETVNVDINTGKRLTAEQVYKYIKKDNNFWSPASIISFGCAGVFNIVDGSMLYFDKELNLTPEYPQTFAIQYSSDLDRVIEATKNYVIAQWKKPGRQETDADIKSVPFAIAWHNGNCYDISFFHGTEFYNHIDWCNCCGSNIHDLKVLKIEDYNGMNIKVIDTLKLFNMPLAKLGEQIGLDKLDGTSTYESAPVPPELPDAEQLTYCFRDIEVCGKALIEYAKPDKENWQTIFDIPYTSTSVVRNAVHKKPDINMPGIDVQTLYSTVYGNTPPRYSDKSKDKKHKIGEYSNYDFKHFYQCNTVEAINNVMLCFDGGICYFNFDQLAKVWDNVDSFDFSTHYDSTMLMCDFPIWAWKFYTTNTEDATKEYKRYKKVKGEEIEITDKNHVFEGEVKTRVYQHFYNLARRAQKYELLTDTDGLFCCAEVVITGLKAKEWDGQMFPYLKTNNKNAMSIIEEFYGGNIVSGTYIGYLTDISFATLTMAYNYDKLTISSVAVCDKNEFKHMKGFKDNLAVVGNIDPIFITSIAAFAGDKTKYKLLEEESEEENGVNHPDTVNYRMLKSCAKSKLNGLYGNTAQNKLNYDVIEIVDGEPITTRKSVWLSDNFEDFDVTESGFKNLISYIRTPEGIKELSGKSNELSQRWISEYVTAYARYFLVYFATYIISNRLGTVLYCDTDSIKVHWNSKLCKRNFINFIKGYRNAYEKNCKSNPLTAKMWDRIEKLGNLDHEGNKNGYTYLQFVTFGNKRYITKQINKKGKIDITCTFAGFSRKIINQEDVKKGLPGLNVVQYDLLACNNDLREFIEKSGVKYHLRVNAEDNRKLDKVRFNEGLVVNFGEDTSAGVLLSPNEFSTTDIDCNFDGELHKLMEDTEVYTFGTLAKEAGIYPVDNVYYISREGKDVVTMLTDAAIESISLG